MAKGLVLMGAVAVIAAVGLGSVLALTSIGPGPPAHQVAASTSDGLRTGVDPDQGSAPGPDVKVAETQAAAKQGKQTEYGLWVYSCAAGQAGEPEKCAARLALRDTKRNVTVVNWLIGHNKDGELLMEITTPVDVLIQPGLQFGIGDGAAQSFPYLSCGADGCVTRIRPDAQLLKDLHQAETVKLTIVTPTGKSLVISLKVTGIAESLDALAKL
jgi:invasion protein IalB